MKNKTEKNQQQHSENRVVHVQLSSNVERAISGMQQCNRI